MSRILLIDEEPATRLIMQNRLRDLGYEIVAADNGARGLHEAHEHPFDLFVIDAGLGVEGNGVSAFEVCKRLKQTPRTAPSPVVFTSKQPSGAEEMRRGFDSGCESFLPKPSLAVLDEVVRAMLRQKSQHDDLLRQNRALEDANRRLQEEHQQGADLGQALKASGGDAGLVQRDLAAARPDGLLLVDGEGIVRHCDRGARELLGSNLEGKNLGRLAPASGLEAFVRDARTESREGFRFDISERAGRAGRSFTAAVVPLVSLPGSRDPEMRIVMLLDGARRRVATELMRSMEGAVSQRELATLREAARVSYSPSSLVGSSPGMQRLRAQVAEAARSRDAVWVQGPPASGKQHTARAIHYSGDDGGAFQVVHCGGLSELNLESELFGQIKGAHPEALSERPGAFQLGHLGTVYLQGALSLPAALQERVLTALKEGKVRRAGSKRVERVDVRVVAGDEGDLHAAVEAGRFRSDLAEALSDHQISLAPLSERGEDVRELAEHFIARHGIGRRLTLTPDSVAKLSGYRWPGNVRERASCMERACLTTDCEVIDVEHLPAPLGDAQVRIGTHEMVPAAPPTSAGAVGGTHTASGAMLGALDRHPWDIGPEEAVSLDLYEKKALLRALHETGGDKLAAARLLGVGKSTLYRKLKRYGI